MDFNFDFTEKRVIITAFFCIAFTIATAIRKNKELGGNKIIIILSGIYSFSLKIFTI